MIPRTIILPFAAREATERERFIMRRAAIQVQRSRSHFRQFIEAAIALFSDDASHHRIQCKCTVCTFEGFGRYGVEEGP